jgi:type III secretory pathway component EscT
MLPLPSDTIPRLILAVACGASRTVPITWMVPTFGGSHVPAEVRIALGILLAFLGLPHLTAGVDGAGLVAAGPLVLVLVLARELAIGVTVGLVASFVFRAAEMAGRLADVMRGANMAEVLVPTSDERTSPTGNLFLFVTTVIFLELGGLGRMMTALLRSYEAIPLGLAGSASGMRGATAVVIAASAKLIEAAVGLAAPVIVALLLADVALGAIARAAPQIPVYFVGMPLKALLGVGVVLVGLGALEGALTGGLGGWLDLIERVWSAWKV